MKHRAENRTNPTVKRSFVIFNPEGLHLRSAMQLAQIANDFHSAITLCCNGSTAEAKSALSLILLEASHGKEVTVIAKGSDAVYAIAAITQLFKAGLK